MQRILDEGEIFHGAPPRLLGFLKVEGRLWRAVIKATADGRATYIQSLHRVDPPRLRRARETMNPITG
ncbi:MAG: hypothetical protein OXO54_10755 [Chloroflexota bacterium]|nr:hypothetical protein [Chloroflexota bacterium]